MGAMIHPLTEIRQRFGLTLQDLADEMQVTKGYLWLIEHRKKDYSPDVQRRVRTAVTAIQARRQEELAKLVDREYTNQR